MQYRVFGRTDYAEPLSERGSIGAPTRAEAERLALGRFGARWVELAIVPEPALRWILRDAGKEAGDRRETQATA